MLRKLCLPFSPYRQRPDITLHAREAKRDVIRSKVPARSPAGRPDSGADEAARICRYLSRLLVEKNPQVKPLLERRYRAQPGRQTARRSTNGAQVGDLASSPLRLEAWLARRHRASKRYYEFITGYWLVLSRANSAKPRASRAGETR